MNRFVLRISLFVGVALAIAAFFVFDLGRYLELSYIKEQQALFAAYYAEHPLKSWVIFGGIYVLVTSLSVPGAAVLTLAAGALFGFLTGLVLVSFASTIGATIAMLVARFVLGDYLQERYEKKLKKVNQGIDDEGGFYLFTMRMIPVFPFFLINILMGLTKFPTIHFFWVSQLAMLPGTSAYIYAGTQIAKIETLSGILSPGLITAFVILAFLPLVLKRLVAFLRRKRNVKV